MYIVSAHKWIGFLLVFSRWPWITSRGVFFSYWGHGDVFKCGQSRNKPLCWLYLDGCCCASLLEKWEWPTYQSTSRLDFRDGVLLLYGRDSTFLVCFLRRLFSPEELYTSPKTWLRGKMVLGAFNAQVQDRIAVCRFVGTRAAGLFIS